MPRDLIETLWNVKAWGFAVLCRSRNDLIETLWNVKLKEWEKKGDVEYRFNRDIVECKDMIMRIGTETLLRFNRDIVECKDKDAADRMMKSAGGFNRDIVECKVFRRNLQYNARMRFNRDIVECKVV